MNYKISMLAACVLATSGASAQQLAINSVAVSGFSKTGSTCARLGGNSNPPTVTIRHSKASGSITVSMEDRLNNGNTVNHGSTSVSADPSGVTKLTHAFLPPCNRRTAEGLKSAYYVTASSGGSTKTVLWARYP